MIIKNNSVPVQDAVFGSAIFRGPVKTKTIVPLLILHLLSKGPEHGYGLMERIELMTGSIMPVNPNTMYPLLRRLEERGFVVGTWEHPDRRSRRIYRITRAGLDRYEQIRVRVRPHLDALIEAMLRLRSEVLSSTPQKARRRRSRASASESGS
ncbi:MAG: PadR family transcriptional regulator [Candidatus Eremiobacteraeota bacterium]|nr:PadR family transcriptional regulator [Candidatus Eremiobacteraeota bacterium]